MTTSKPIQIDAYGIDLGTINSTLCRTSLPPGATSANEPELVALRQPTPAGEEDALNEIRKNFTPSLGKDHGRVVLKAAKPHLVARLTEFRTKLEAHQKAVAAGLQTHLDESRKQIVAYYEARVIEAKPDALLGQSLHGEISEVAAKKWLNGELDKVFPSAESLIQEMKLDERYKDVTFETLNREDFLDSVKVSFPQVDWDKAYSEFKAAGESGGKEGAK